VALTLASTWLLGDDPWNGLKRLGHRARARLPGLHRRSQAVMRTGAVKTVVLNAAPLRAKAHPPAGAP